MLNVLILVKSRRLLTSGVILSLGIAAVPAQAQGIFGFLNLFSQPSAPAPVYRPFEDGIPAVSQPRRKPVRPKPAPAEPAAVKMPEKPKAPGEIDNPVPALLADSTLRPGDMVMFPDGLRVFTGKPGGQHKLTDFQPLSQAGKSLSRETRKLIADLHPGVNTAWSTAGVQSQGKLAANTRDVTTTGSVKRTKP
jgi:hypothetical protein